MARQKAAESFTFKGKSKLRVYQATLPLYNLPYYIYISDSMVKSRWAAEEDWPGINLEAIGPDTGAYAVTISHPDEGESHLMILNAGLSNPQLLHAVCAHESLHIAWHMIDSLGIKLEYNNHEAQAYIMMEIFQQSKLALEDFNRRYKLKLKF